MKNKNNRPLSLKLSQQGTSSLSSSLEVSLDHFMTSQFTLFLLFQLCTTFHDRTACQYFVLFRKNIFLFFVEHSVVIHVNRSPLQLNTSLGHWLYRLCHRHFHASSALQQALVPRIPATTLWNCILMSWRNGSESGRVAFTVCPSPPSPPPQRLDRDRGLADPVGSTKVRGSAPGWSDSPRQRESSTSYRHHDKT